MVSDLFRGAVVVTIFCVLIMLAAFTMYEPPGAEGPYRKRENERCVCR